MATNSLRSRFDFETLVQEASGQFRGLNPNEPGQWPIIPKILAWIAVAVLIVVVGWFLVLSSALDELDRGRTKEPALMNTYRERLSQAVNLPTLRKQKLQVQEYVTQLEKQLPGKAEMDALLSDINQAGGGRGLQFDLIRPAQVVVRDYYAELPFSIRVIGRYHDIGAFTADIATLSRIVTLHNLTLTTTGKEQSGLLVMEAAAKTYRYLDDAEIEQGRKSAAKAKSGAGK